MARRIDVELTSKREDGRWTWRAAGAKQPKGELDASVLYEGAKVGDVVRAEADFEIEGIVITSVLPPREKKRSEPERVEVVGSPRDERGVTASLTGKPEGGRPDKPRRGKEGRSDERRGPGRRDSSTPGDHGRRDEAGHGRNAARRPARPPERRSEGGAAARPRPERHPDGRPEKPRPAGTPAARGKRLTPGHTHRDAVLAGLPPEHRPIAEQVLRGGLPGVRQAVEVQNAQLRQEGQTEVHAAPLLTIAEQLLPQLKAADWRDRAEAAVKMIDELSVRDLRAVVTGADTARDPEGRLLAGTLRDALDQRLQKQREAWIADINAALEDGRLVRALRASAHPPDPGTRLPAEVALRLSDAASAAMAPDAPCDRWQALLEAVVDSAVRRSVKPAGLPEEAPEGLLAVARQASGKVPALAGLLGIAMPPPPGPPRLVRSPSAGSRTRRSPGGRPGAPIPPPPPPPSPPPPQPTGA